MQQKEKQRVLEDSLPKWNWEGGETKSPPFLYTIARRNEELMLFWTWWWLWGFSFKLYVIKVLAEKQNATVVGED